MRIVESKNHGKILIDCLICGSFFEIDDFRESDFSEAFERFYMKSRKCDSCEQKELEKKHHEEEEKEKRIRASKLRETLENNGFEKNYIFEKATGNFFKVPPCRYVAEFVYRNRNKNLLLSGTTGSGKSTSASFVAMQMLKSSDMKIKYFTLRKLLAEWRSAKTSDKDFVSEKMLYQLFENDIIIIDEFIGKAKVSDSGQELIFAILEAINNGSCGSRIWILGNFYSGSIEEMFEDPDPVRRRLQENFLCAVIDEKEKTVKQLTVWK